MSEKLPSHFLDLVSAALLASFWRKGALRTFLRRVGIKESFLSTWAGDETKRDFLLRTFPRLESSESGRRTILEIARELGCQTTFPDLEGWEDTEQKKARAREAVRNLNEYLRQQEAQARASHESAASRKRAQELRNLQVQRRADLERLRARLDGLATTLGTQEAGYAFEQWFYEMVAYFEVLARLPYNTNGRQIDGTITCDGTTYLIELKFTSKQADATDIDVFHRKVSDKADNTMGIMVSISGYSAVAIDGASGPRTPLLLLDHGHLYALLGGTMSLPDLIGRVRRHSSQTSQAYLPAADM